MLSQKTLWHCCSTSPKSTSIAPFWNMYNSKNQNNILTHLTSKNKNSPNPRTATSEKTFLSGIWYVLWLKISLAHLGWITYKWKGVCEADFITRALKSTGAQLPEKITDGRKNGRMIKKKSDKKKRGLEMC